MFNCFVTYCILNRVQLDIKKVFQFGGFLSTFSEIGSVFAGPQRAALFLREVGAIGQNLLDPGDAQAGGFLELAAAGKAWDLAIFLVFRGIVCALTVIKACVSCPLRVVLTSIDFFQE